MSKGLKVIIVVFGFLILLCGGLSVAIYFLGFKNIDISSRGHFSQVYEEEIHSLDFEMGLADVQIIAGNSFTIRGENVILDHFSSNVKDGTWNVGYSNKGQISLQGNKTLFQDNSAKIYITIPSEFTGVSAEISTGMGTLYVERLDAEDILLEVGMGDLTADRLIANRITTEVGMGTIKAYDVTANRLISETGMGDTSMAGKINGDISIDVGMGNASLTLFGLEKDYNYSAEVGMGDIKVGSEAGQKHLSDKQTIDNGAEWNIAIDCGMGAVKIQFAE